MLNHINRQALPVINDNDFRRLLDVLQATNDGPVFFVEIGAFDGRSGDPIYHKVVQYDWCGLLVEPVKESFQRLRQTYAGNPYVILENVAIDREHGQRSMFKKTGQLSAAALDHNINFETGEITEELVMCTTLPALLQKHKIHRIDLLQVDAEGKDLEIIEDFDFATYSPAVINFEANVISNPQRTNDVLTMLQGLGYNLYNHRWHQAEGDITATTLDW